MKFPEMDTEKALCVPVPNELYEFVVQAAEKAGVSPEEFLKNTLQEKLTQINLCSERNWHTERTI